MVARGYISHDHATFDACPFFLSFCAVSARAHRFSSVLGGDGARGIFMSRAVFYAMIVLLTLIFTYLFMKSRFMIFAASIALVAMGIFAATGPLYAQTLSSDDAHDEEYADEEEEVEEEFVEEEEEVVDEEDIADEDVVGYVNEQDSEEDEDVIVSPAPVPTLYTAPISSPASSPVSSPVLETVTDQSAFSALMDSREDAVIDSSDTPANRAKKLKNYWALYRESGSDKVYAITTSETKREIQTMSFFTAFNANFGIRLVTKGALDAFPTGDAITSTVGLDLTSFKKAAQNCRLMKVVNNPTVYLVCLKTKRIISNEKTFRQFGWDFADVWKVSADELNAFIAGEMITESTMFDQSVLVEGAPRGTVASGSKSSSYSLIKPEGSPKIYVVTSDGVIHRILNLDVVRTFKINLKKVKIVPANTMSNYIEGDAVSVDNAASFGL